MRFILLSLFASSQVFAQSSSTKIDTSSQAADQSKTEMNRVLGIKQIEDPNVITDQKLKADEGSRSKYSVKFNLMYAGPGITDLGNKDQPNPDHVRTVQTKLSGNVGARYRIDGVSAINAGTGITAVHPLNGWDRTDVSTPFISYDRSSRIYEFQVRQTYAAADVTIPEYVAAGEFAAIAYGLDIVRQIGYSRFSAGLETRLDYFFYGRGYEAQNNADFMAPRYYLSALPNLKFKVTDNLNINTYFVMPYYNLRANPSSTAVIHRTFTQRLGIGYSLAKDVYLNPYITWFAGDIRTNTTTFNLGAVFSVL